MTLYLVFSTLAQNRVRETLRFATSIQPICGLASANRLATLAIIALDSIQLDQSIVAIEHRVINATAISPSAFLPHTRSDRDQSIDQVVYY